MKSEAMRRIVTAGVAAATLLSAVPSWAQSPPEHDEIARGQEIVTRKCAQCHAVGLTGDSPNPTAPRFRRLHERYDVEALSEGLAEGLTVGHGPMPEWTFAPQDVSAIVAYLKSIQTPEAAKVPATPQR